MSPSTVLKYDFSPEQLGVSKTAQVDVSAAIENLEKSFSDCDAVILTSKDQFISEYVPLSNNPRYGATGFTGSTGDAVYWTKKFRAKLKAEKGIDQKPVSLFVDGRYHLQADQETPPPLVEVVKVEVEPTIESALRERAFQIPSLKIGMDYERTAIATLEQRAELASKLGSSMINLRGEEILKALNLKGWKVDRPIYSLPESATGRTPAKILQDLAKDMHAVSGTSDCLLMTAATDDAAFLLNARGFHLPYVSSFLAYTFFAGSELIVYLPASSKECKVEIDPKQMGSYTLTIVRDDLAQLRSSLGKHKVSAILFNGATMNGFLPTFAKELFPAAKINPTYYWILRTRTRKTPEEMNSIRTCFVHSSRAIAKTLRWGKVESQKRPVSELDLAQYLSQSYAEEGALTLSFGTISGAGPNSAIVHYNTPSSKTYFEKGMLALLDSGACYDNGFLTDCTRGFFVGGGDSGVTPEAWQKEIYTTTLKGAMIPFLQPVDAKLSGKEVDAVIRGQIHTAGYDYLHGTGHGVGIHVHEEGIRLSTLSIYPQSPYACVSVEPGIYLKGKGGVRVENIALLIPEGESHYRYENVVTVGYDWDLIDLNQLTSEEKTYLKTYEAKCREMGTQLMDCPL